MYVIDRGGVETYDGRCDDVVYLMTDVERLVEGGTTVVMTDRNAVLDISEFTTDTNRLDDLIDWPLMRATMWSNTDDQPDRKERRMAECLIHARIPWEAFTAVTAKTKGCARQAEETLTTVGVELPVLVRPKWYF